MAFDPAITFSGLASGLDTGALVEALLEIERAPIQRLESRRAQFQNEESLYQEFNTRLAALGDSAALLDNQNSTLSAPSLDEEFYRFAATSSDETVLEVSVDGVPNPGNFDIDVVSLASAARVISNAQGDPAALFGALGDSISIDYGAAAAIDISVPAGGISLEGLRDAINTDANNDGGVQASILDDGLGGYRLVVAGRETGAANDVTLSESFGGGFDLVDESAGQSAADAQLSVFGVDVFRPENTIADLIPGVSLEVSTPGTASVTINRDLEAITENVQAFVDAYNNVAQFISDNTGFDAANEIAGALIGDSTVSSVERTLRRVIAQDQYSNLGSFSYASDIGIRIGQDGQLSFEKAVFESALGDDPESVRLLFGGNGSDEGFAARLAGVLDPILETGGLVDTRVEGIDDQIDRIDGQIDRLELLLASREQTLRRQFTQLESLLSSLQAQSGFLNSLGTQQS